MPVSRLQNFIGGEFVPPWSQTWFADLEPATGLPLVEVPDSDEHDVEAAVAAASTAFPSWSATPAAERSKVLLKIAQLIEDNIEAFAALESDDTGKPLTLARSLEIPRAIANLRFFAGAVQGFSSEAHVMESGTINYTIRAPLGVVGCISPWNLPLYLFTWKIAPALAAGCCVVAKPSELTPLTANRLAEVSVQASLPPGVLNIVHGYGAKAGAAIVAHPQIPALSFTGGTVTGKAISSVAAPMFKKLSLELGGKNPVVIFADAPYDEMLETTVRSAFQNQGEICLCGSRIFIERPLYDRFRDDFVARTKALKIGDPREPATVQGALISEAHLKKVQGYFELAQQEGGRILTGGRRVAVAGRCAGGWFLQPTVIEGLSFECRTNQEEIFGPIVTIAPFDSEEEALACANSTRYGLAATLWTSDLRRAHRVANRLETGIVWVNCWMLRDLRTPFGGVKQSGVGREGGLEALRFFTEPKNVCMKI